MSPTAPTRGERIVTRLTHAFLALMVCAALAYPVDWIVWRIRMAHGSGLENISVSQVTAAELKNNKEEYYWDGNVTMTCARSMLPESTYPACWYLRRHMETITRP